MKTIADIAVAAEQRKQYGLVTTTQALDAGLSYAALRRRVKAGALIRVHQGVFRDPAVEPSFEQRSLAAVLAAGDASFASHETAAQLAALPLPWAAAIEFTTVLERSPHIAGVRRHRSGLMVDVDYAVARGIPIATPERTIIDLSGRLEMRSLAKMTDDALHRRLTTIGRIRASVMRLPPAPGRSPKTVMELIARRAPDDSCRESGLEDFVFDSLRRYALPLPVCQHPVRVGGRERRVDLSYPEAWLALEAQGFNPHGRRAQFDSDALRGNELQLAGFRVLQFTSAFTDERIATQVAAALAVPLPRVAGPPLTFAAYIERLERECA